MKKILKSAERFIKSYIAGRNGLKKLGIVRSGRSVEADFAEWYSCKLLKLKLNPNGVMKDYDAVDSKGKKYQIKSRVVKRGIAGFHFKNLNRGCFDYLVGVLFDDKCSVLSVYKMPVIIVKQRAHKNLNDYRFRVSKKAQSFLKKYIVYQVKQG